MNPKFVFAALFLVATTPALAYEGLIAPSAEETTRGGGSSGGGYEGLISAPPSSPARRSTADEPPGYQGVIPGAVPSAPAGGSRQAPQTAAPGNVKKVPLPQGGSQALKNTAMVERAAAEAPNRIGNGYKVSEKLYQALAQERPKVNGMWPAEASYKNQIDMLMRGISDAQNADRAAKIAQAEKQLTDARTALDAQRNVSPDLYRKMGLPENYIEEQIKGVPAALARVEQALKELKNLK